jgi:hypothetical protein
MNLGPIKLEWMIDTDDPGWGDFLTAYRPFLDRTAGHLTIEAEIIAPRAGAARPVLPASFIRHRRLKGSDFVLGDDLIRGSARGPARLACSIHPILLTGQGLRVLEQFLYLLFYETALARAARESEAPFLLHSSGVLHRGGVFAFCGPAGSGKSTALSLCPAGSLLGDEALVFSGGRGEAPRTRDWRVASSPINPFCPKSGGGGPLARLCLLEQAPQHALADISRREAVPRLVAEVIAPIGLFETDLSLAMGRALTCALSLFATGRVKRLRFRPDPGFWSLLDPDD